MVPETFHAIVIALMRVTALLVGAVTAGVGMFDVSTVKLFVLDQSEMLPSKSSEAICQYQLPPQSPEMFVELVVSDVTLL